MPHSCAARATALSASVGSATSELASRLSFLWSSIPDDELLDLAIQGKLHDPAVLERQTRRMLADSRSQAFTTNFAGQWLSLRRLPDIVPDPFLFPDYGDTLALAFQREAELFFDSVVREDLPTVDLLTADYTFVNERLAQHYGIPNVKGVNFRRVSLAEDSPRRGLLGKGAILTVTALPNRTSPVVRGKWVLQPGAPPPEPPPNTRRSRRMAPGHQGADDARGSSSTGRTVRARRHADGPSDLRWRASTRSKYWTFDENFEPIDNTGCMPTARESMAWLLQVLVNHSNQFLNVTKTCSPMPWVAGSSTTMRRRSARFCARRHRRTTVFHRSFSALSRALHFR